MTRTRRTPGSCEAWTTSGTSGWVTAHTLAKLQTAFYALKLLDNASFEQ